MPLCVSCQGEYPLPRKTSTGQAQVNSTEEPFVCRRCSQDNRVWDDWLNEGVFAHLRRFILNFWGFLIFGFLLLAVIVLIFALPIVIPLIGLPLAVLLILVCLLLFYVLKESLWRYDLLARVGRGFRPTLIWLAVISFVLAMLFGAGSMALAQATTTPTPRSDVPIGPEYVTPTATPIPPPTETPIPTPPPTFTPTFTPMPTLTPTPTPCYRPCYYNCW